MNTEKHAAEILLERGVSWPVSAPWYLKITGRTMKITVKALTLGTLLEMSRCYAGMGIKTEDIDKDPHGVIKDHLNTVCSIAAVAILNSRLKIKLFTKPLSRYIMKRFTPNMLLEVMIFIITYSGVTSFLNTIRLIGDMRITAPKNLSPQDQGSQQSQD